MFVTFPVVKSEGWGVIGGLEEGEYQFSVVASVTVGDVKMEGERAETAAVTVKETGRVTSHSVLVRNILHIHVAILFIE